MAGTVLPGTGRWALVSDRHDASVWWLVWFGPNATWCHLDAWSDSWGGSGKFPRRENIVPSSKRLKIEMFT